jgi:hypothetical protein
MQAALNAYLRGALGVFPNSDPSSFQCRRLDCGRCPQRKSACSPDVTTKHGATRGPGQPRHPAFTNSSLLMPRATSIVSGQARVIPKRAITAITTALGTSSFSTISAQAWAAAPPPRLKANGSKLIWLPTRRPAQWLSGISRFIAPRAAIRRLQ